MVGTARLLQYVLVAFLLALPGGSPRAAAKYDRNVVQYAVPDVTLVNQNGERVKLLELVDSGRPVLLDFIYATCTTICPVLSAGYSHLQKKVEDPARDIQLISVTIDPEHDTPELMTQYLRRYGAKPGWQFLTGTRADIDRVMRAFDAYVANKMSHYPVTFLKAPGQERWVRIYGLMSGTDLMAEYEKLRGR